MSYQCVFNFDEGATTVDLVAHAPAPPLLNKGVIVPTIMVASISPNVNELMDKLERDGVDKVRKDDIPFNENVILKIMENGAHEFKEGCGRNMTYLELRRIYG